MSKLALTLLLTFLIPGSLLTQNEPLHTSITYTQRTINNQPAIFIDISLQCTSTTAVYLESKSGENLEQLPFFCTFMTPVLIEIEKYDAERGYQNNNPDCNPAYNPDLKHEPVKIYIQPQDSLTFHIPATQYFNSHPAPSSGAIQFSGQYRIRLKVNYHHGELDKTTITPWVEIRF